MTPDTTKNEISANIRIETSQDELIVTNPASRSLQTVVYGSAFCIFLLFEGSKLIHQAFVNSHSIEPMQASQMSLLSKIVIPALPLLLFAVFLWLIFQLVRPLCGSKQVLRCTREIIEITYIDFGREWRRRQFIRTEVHRFEFAAVGVSKYGAILGLKFNYQGKTIKFFAGLKAVEAQTILQEAKRLGVDTLIDPAMRMIVEIESSRRKSFFRFIG